MSKTKSVKTNKSGKTYDVFKQKKITNPYNSGWFKHPDTPVNKHHTAIFTK